MRGSRRPIQPPFAFLEAVLDVVLDLAVRARAYLPALAACAAPAWPSLREADCTALMMCW